MPPKPPPTPNNCQTCPIHHQRQTTPPGIKVTYQRKFDIATELEIVCNYCKNQSSLQIAKAKDCTQDTIQNIIRRYNQPLRSLRDAQLLRRGSKDLTFPLSTEVPHLLTNPTVTPYLPHLIAVMLLTDGGAGYRQGHRPYITFTNKAHPLHAIFADLIHYHYHQPPSAYFKPYWSKPNKQGSKAYYTTYNRKKETQTMLQDLLKLSPTFRTRPKRGQPWEEYLQEKIQPSLQFLIEDDISEKSRVFAVRLAMCTEGSITPMFRNDSSKPFPHLVFSCQHPRLLEQWQKFFNLMDLDLSPSEGRLESGRIKTVKKFLQMGGFFPGIFVQKGSYYEGFTKQQVLKGIFLAREQATIDPQSRLKEKHEIIREFAAKIPD